MGRGIIQHPETKKYAIWSSVVDDFITDWLSEEELKQWQINDYAEQIKEQPIKVSRFLTFDECLHTLETYHGKDRVNEVKDGEKVMETKILEFGVASRNGTIISKDAFENQDDKSVPLKWRTGKDAEVIGIVDLEVYDDGISMSMDKETYERIMEKING